MRVFHWEEFATAFHILTMWCFSERHFSSWTSNPSCAAKHTSRWHLVKLVLEKCGPPKLRKVPPKKGSLKHTLASPQQNWRQQWSQWSMLKIKRENWWRVPLRYQTKIKLRTYKYHKKSQSSAGSSARWHRVATSSCKILTILMLRHFVILYS